DSQEMNWFVMMTRKMVPFKVLLIVSLLLAAHLINGHDGRLNCIILDCQQINSHFIILQIYQKNYQTAKMTASLVPPLGYSKEKMMVNYLRLMKCLMVVFGEAGMCRI